MRAYEKVWILGDGFMAHSFTQHFQDVYSSSNKTGYIRAHYDVTPLCNGTVGKGGNRNILNRLQNTLVAEINRQILLPKAIVIVVDNDITDTFNHYNYRFSQAIDDITEWFRNQFHRIIKGHKEKLPSRSRKFKFPTILWAEIPLHEIYGHYNEYKKKYNESIRRVASLFCEMTTLSLSSSWSFTELSYFSEGKINGNGLSTYWQAINDAFENWDRAQMNALQNKENSASHHPNYNSHQQSFNSCQGNKAFYHERWENYDRVHWKTS